jgi:Holliday junction resolvasome RuvABC endonuclease subunit
VNVLALDPATATGFAHSNGEHGTWDLGHNRWPDMPGGKLHKLRERIIEVHAQWGPIELVAFEEASFGGNQSGKRKMQMQVIVFHNKIRGIIEEAACDIGAKLLPVNPTSLKAWATDNGHATKADMMRMLERHYGIRTSDDNEADAIWILKWAEHVQKHPQLRTPAKVVKKRQKVAGKKQPRWF